MTPPAEAVTYFGAACGLGAILGLLYGFLRPLRPKRTALADWVFIVALAYCWLVLCFGVCGGDIRLGYVAGLGIGCVAWEATLGKLIRPAFFLFWKVVAKAWAWFVRPWKKFLKKNRKFLQKSICILQKMG